MGLHKTYLRYSAERVLGVVTSNRGNVAFWKSPQNASGEAKRARRLGRTVLVTPSLEDVVFWDCRTHEKTLVLRGEKEEATWLTLSPDQQLLAVGYADGDIKLWSLPGGSSSVTLRGHKSAVSALRFDSTATRLASGSQDTDVILWDIVNECGLFRLKGHKGPITDCHFLPEDNVLVTSSTDTFVKLWDLETKHCFQTLVGHRHEVCSLAIIANGSRLVTGSADRELRVWSIKRAEDCRKSEDESDECSQYQVQCELIGSVHRQSRHRVLMLNVDSEGQVLGCLGADSFVEFFQIRTEVEIEAQLKRRAKRARKQQKLKVEKGKADEGDTPRQVERCVDDELPSLNVLHTDSKIKSFDLLRTKGESTVQVLLHLQDNCLEVHRLDIDQKDATDLATCVQLPGHRSAPRSLAFSSDGSSFLSGSSESLKLWNTSSGQCVRTMQCGYAVSCVFVPKERHAVVGCKTGELQLFNLVSGELMSTVQAHKDTVWSVCAAPDKRGVVTGGGDKFVRFWEYELEMKTDGGEERHVLVLTLVREMEMEDQVLCVKYSPDQRLLAVSLLNNQVKVFFADSLKFLHALYGHSLPAVSLDISSDGTLLVTGSSDKTCRLWGLDFGDCRKILKGHEASIMAVQFVPKTNYFFSASKDHTIRYWDGGKFEHISTLEGHHAEVWCLAISENGRMLVSGSHDRSIRLWSKTHEQLIPFDEREQEREEAADQDIATSHTPVIPGEVQGEAALAGKQSVEALTGTEKLIEAIDLAKEEQQRLKEYAQKKTSKAELAQFEHHYSFIAAGITDPERFVLKYLRNIRASELEVSLLVLPFSYVIQLLKLLDVWIRRGWEVELCCRALFFLMRIHHDQIVATEELLTVVDSLRTNTYKQLTAMKDIVGFNLAGLSFLREAIESRKVRFFSDAAEKVEMRRKRQRAAVKTLR